MKKAVGVFGSAEGNITDGAIKKAGELGRAIASNGCLLVSGACTGLPYEASKAAREAGGIAIGISPAKDLEDHVEKYGFPTEHFDYIVFTGFGRKGRNVVAVRSCDFSVFISGRIGTLNEFTIAYDSGKPVGIISGTGGITEMFPEIVRKADKKTGCVIVEDPDPSVLVRKLLESVKG